MTPYDVQISRSLKWMHNKAPSLTQLVLSKERWYQENQKQFWSDWLANVFDLRTADDFGMLVWCMILGVPSENFSFAPPKHQFAYGDLRENFVWSGARDGSGKPVDPLGNDIGGNFSAGRSGSVYDPEEIRRLLQIRYASLISDGSLSFVNFMLRWVFNNGQPWDFANKRYFYCADETLAASAALNILRVRLTDTGHGTRYGQMVSGYYNAISYSYTANPTQVNPNTRAWGGFANGIPSPETDALLPQFVARSGQNVFRQSRSQTFPAPSVQTGKVRVSFLAKFMGTCRFLRVNVNSDVGNHQVDFDIQYGNYTVRLGEEIGEASITDVGGGRWLCSMIASRVPNQNIFFEVILLNALGQESYSAPIAAEVPRAFVGRYQAESTEFIPMYRGNTAGLGPNDVDNFPIDCTWNQAATNILYNPSFNVPTPGAPNIPLGWNVLAQITAVATVDPTTGSGYKEFKCTTGPLNGSNPSGSYAVVTPLQANTPAVTSNEQLCFSAYIRGPLTMQAFFLVQYKNASGAVLQTLIAPAVNLTSDDQRITFVPPTAQAGTAQMTIYIYLQGAPGQTAAQGDVFVSRPQVERSAIIGPWNDPSNPAGLPGRVTFTYVPPAGSRLEWQGSWGTSNNGGWNYGGTFDGTLNYLVLGKPSDYMNPVAAGKIEYRVGAGLPISTGLMELLRDDEVRILPTFAGIRASVIQET